MDDQRETMDDESGLSDQPTARLHPASMPALALQRDASDPLAEVFGASASVAPTGQSDGGLSTYLGQPSNANLAANAARAAQDSAQQDINSIAASVVEIASVLHEHARRLEPFVEGTYSTDLADPRTHVLAQALSIARQADLHLARLGATLQRLNSSVQTAQSNLDALQRERERLATLYAIAQELNTSLDLEDLLGRVIAQLIEVVRAERGFLMLWDDTTHRLQFTAARGADAPPLAEADFNISQGVVERVWQSQEPLLTLDARDDARLQSQESVINYGIRSIMCAPLRVRGHGVGIVYVDSRNRAALFDATHLDLLAAFCNQAAIAIDNARLFADLRRRIREISAMKTYTDNIFASIASGVVTADTLGQVTAFNRAAEHIFGLAGERALGHAYSEVLASIGDAELAEIMRRAVIEREVTLGHEVDRTLPGRGDVSLRLNVSPLRGGADDESEALGVAMVVDDLTELRRSQRQTKEIQRLFGRYVHPAVVRQLLADPTAVNLGGETREISVVFADIRGYTRLAEELAPDELVRILNSYLNILTEAIWQQEGTVTMFIGDALMAIFNAPLPQPDHAIRAVRAAWAMRQALECAATTPGMPSVPVEYGIGVHTGLAVVGNIGAAERLQNYTALGDAVNTAQRLQSNASANEILLSAATYIEVAHLVNARELNPLSVKGKTQPLSVYQLDGLR
ncbi:MAG: Adenylate cyclase [Ktedonobacterales bacterium]|jgi:PAS domain S-box-containing protein|nr:MAG: Adenylate cyclase [Ktedonobacterales bacterium]